MKKVAVITDATSPDYLFPVWRRYYGGLFGEKNLFVVTYRGLGQLFDASKFGFVWELGADFGETVRARVISSLVASLLEAYDVVLRCDADEILVADPSNFANLATYVERMSRPYITARGIDLIESPADTKLDTGAPILIAQRQRFVRSSALNKTCITTTPIVWAEGFHAASVYPALDEVLLVHLKFADVQGRIDWFVRMLAAAGPGSREHSYYSDGQQKLTAHQKWCLQLPPGAPGDPANLSEFDRKFLDSVEYNPKRGLYQGKFGVEPKLYELPSAYSGVF